MIPHRWRRNAADNGSADPLFDARPGRPANTILGIIRSLMASGAASRDDAIGELVAVLGAGNVYAVGTNEGLIDVGTGVNGVPAAIKAPFLLRLSVDTTLSGSGTTTPHLKVDGFDCGPMQRRDGSALADGDLVKGVPVLLLGEMAQATDTQVTRVRVLDLTPGEQVGPRSQCRLSVASPTQVVLKPFRGNQLWVNGANRTIPSTGLTLANTGLNAIDANPASPTFGGPFYHVYVPPTGNVLEADPIGHVTAADGSEVKAGDPTRAWVGMVALEGTPGGQGTFVDTPAKRYLASNFGRRPRELNAGAPTVATTGSLVSYVEMSPLQRIGFLALAEETCILNNNGNSANDTDVSGAHISIGVDGQPVGGDVQGTSYFANYYNGCGASYVCSPAEGFHVASPLIKAHNTGTAKFSTQNSGMVRS